MSLPFESARSLVAKIKSREISSVDLLKLYFDRVDQHNPKINAIIVQMREEALKRAQQADDAIAKGIDWGPLHGLPMTVKESYQVAGTPSTWGAPHLKNNIATSDALAIQRLKNAGAVIFGKTNVPLMLADFQSYNDIYGTTNNPWNLERIPGGSSGGSAAALASGMTGLETGSDIGGSIRNPAHFCGVFGHKPTWGLVPPRGHAMPGVLAPSDISVIGPLARSAFDLETAVKVMAGPNEIDSRGLKLELPSQNKTPAELKIAVWRDDKLAPVDDEISERVDQVAHALMDLGVHIDFDARPDFDPEEGHLTFQKLLQATMSSRQADEQFFDMVKSAEALEPDNNTYSAQLQRASVSRFREWSKNNESRTGLRWAWHEFFTHFDAIITPIMATPAIPHDHRPGNERQIIVNNKPQSYYTQVFWSGLTGGVYLPSTIIPTGPNSEGLPIGVQIAGPEYGDLVTIGLAQLLEREGFRFQPAPGYE